MSSVVGDYICLDWYDGPLCEIARVDFGDDSPPHSLIQIRTLGWVEDGDRTVPIPVRAAVVARLDRETLQSMIDLLDGKPVKDIHDR